MSWVVGIDGCKAGWIAVGQQLPQGPVKAAIVTKVVELETHFPGWSMLAVDMPIGLPDSGSRRADISARRFVQPRGSSVFPALNRPLLSCGDYREACSLSWELSRKLITQQAWNLKEKICDVDELVEPASVRAKVWEVHPEVSFRLLLGSPLLFSKRSKEGFAIRLALIEKWLPGAFGLIRPNYMVIEADNDDILDALAALWSGWRILEGKAKYFPEEPFELDPCGRRMVISA